MIDSGLAQTPDEALNQALEALRQRLPGKPTRALSPAELDHTLRELAQFSKKIPPLPDEALSRESIYRDARLMPDGDTCLLDSNIFLRASMRDGEQGAAIAAALHKLSAPGIRLCYTSQVLGSATFAASRISV